MKIDNRYTKRFLLFMILILIGFVAGFILCFMITNNYLESAKVYMAECQNMPQINQPIKYGLYKELFPDGLGNETYIFTNDSFEVIK